MQICAVNAAYGGPQGGSYAVVAPVFWRFPLQGVMLEILRTPKFVFRRRHFSEEAVRSARKIIDNTKDGSLTSVRTERKRQRHDESTGRENL